MRIDRVALAACVAGTAAYLVAARSQTLAWRVLPLAVALAGHAAVLVLAARGREPGHRLVIGATVVLVALAVAVPPLHSRDVYLYAMQGRIVAVHGANPYTTEPRDFPDDPVLPEVSKPFRDGYSFYGPAFTAVEAAGAAVAGDSPTRVRLVFQGLAAAGVLGALALLHRRGVGPGGLALVGLSPVVVAKGVNEGHVDVVLGLVVLGAVLLAERRRLVAAAVVIGLACLVKVLALVCLAGLAVWVLATRGWRAAAATGAVASGVVAAGYLVAGGIAALAPLGEAALHQSRASIWAQPRRMLTAALAGDGVAGVEAGATASLVVSRLALVTVAVVAAVVVLALRRDHSPAPAVGGAFVAYLLAGVYVPAWYVTGALPTLAVRWRSPLAVVATAHAALLAFAYVYSPHLGDDPLAPALRGLFTWVVPALEVAAITAVIVGRRGVAGGGRPPSPDASREGPTPPPSLAPAP